MNRAQVKITLPWPDPILSPNSRKHWRAKVGPKQSARINAGWATVAAFGHRAAMSVFQDSGDIPLRVTFFPPDKRRRDDDNMIGAFKAARDGIAEALGVDDNRFKATYHIGGAEKPGRIEVEL